jgi:hypothetical protein
MPLLWPQGGVFMWTGYAQTGHAPSAPSTYDPREERDAIFAAVRNLDPDQPSDLLAFVNQWGVLGLNNPVRHWNPQLFPFDSVAAMADWVRCRQAVLAAYMRLRVRRPGQWREVANALGPAFRAGVYTLVQDQNQPLTWPLLAEALNWLIGPFPHRVMVAAKRLRPAYGLDSLAQLINLELWYHVTLGQEFRRCEGCQDAFVPSRPNQAFHSAACGNKARQQRWRDAKPRRTRRERHRTSK